MSEAQYLAKWQSRQETAEAARATIETYWDDEYKMYTGDQWHTSFAYRKNVESKNRPNSVNNFIFPAIISKVNALTAIPPKTAIQAREPDDEEMAEKLTFCIDMVRDKNRYPSQYKKIVKQGVQHGCFIESVEWDNTWEGGKGPDRWVGEIKLKKVDKQDFFPDPAILELDERLQDCEFITIRTRQKIDWFKERFDQDVQEDDNEDKNEGDTPNMAYLYTHWHRGKPDNVPTKWAKKFREKAENAENEFEREKFNNMAEGKIDGIHRFYRAGDTYLEYEPYVYEDGLYPFVYKTLYTDEQSQWGFGEIRQVMVPQVLHNKADEIEIEAMCKEGLGGAYYQSNALTNAQKRNIELNNGKGGMLFPVENVNLIKDRTGAKVPASITNYKEHAQRMVENITQNTPVMQGLSQGANMPYSSIRELGMRADARTQGIAEKLEDFLVDETMLIVSRIGQFYTEPRKVRMTGEENESVYNEFSRDDLMKDWEREVQEEVKKEEFIPEFDIEVKVVTDKPTGRDYWVNIAMELFKGGVISFDNLYYTLEEGKLPPKEEIENAGDTMGLISELMQNLTPEELQAFQQSTPEEQEEILENLRK